MSALVRLFGRLSAPSGFDAALLLCLLGLTGAALLVR